MYYPELSDGVEEAEELSATDLIMLKLCQQVNLLNNQ